MLVSKLLINETGYLVRRCKLQILLLMTYCIQATVSTFFGIAIVAAISRTLIRVYKFRRIYVDDYFLFLAVAALIGAVGLFYASVSELYMLEGIVTGKVLPPSNPFQRAVDTATYATTALVVGWTAIFAVKFSFLFYFRTLIKRMHNLTVWWWCVFVVCVPVAFTNIFGTFIVCPYVGVALGMTSSKAIIRHPQPNLSQQNAF